MQVEHLLLSFTLQQLQLLPPAHHVTQIPHLHNGNNMKHSAALIQLLSDVKQKQLFFLHLQLEHKLNYSLKMQTSSEFSSQN